MLLSKTNIRRANRAAVAVEAYLNIEGVDGILIQETVTDMLTDLWHLCDRENMSQLEIMGLSFKHYKAETKKRR